MLNCTGMVEAMKRLKSWEFITSFAVGGFGCMGFSKQKPNMLLIVSDQMETVYDSEAKSLIETEAAVDWKEYTAICELMPDEMIDVAAEWGGSLPQETPDGDRIVISLYGDHEISGKILRFQKIEFIEADGSSEIIYDSYPSYTCGFSLDGRSFALADDGGIYILRKR